MCSMSKKFLDKKKLTKEDLENMLKDLRKDKENKELYEGDYLNDSYRMMACCYSVSPEYCNTIKYFGVHLCNSCGKQFGKNLKDSIKECQLRQYKAYLESESNNVKMNFCNCFSNLTNDIAEEDYDFKSILKRNDLSLTIRVNEKSFIRSLSYEFNRKLSFEEWCSLNKTCFCDKDGNEYNDEEENSQCFILDSSITSYESLVKKYNKLNLSAELKYNCPDCCKKGKKVFEFWIKFPDKKEYVISYPDANSSYNDYSIVYKYLSGNNNYINLIQSMEKESFTRIDKLDIDCALNNIVGTNIVYGKTELKNMFKLYCSKNDIDDKYKQKFKAFIESYSDSKITPQVYSDFLNKLEEEIYNS